MADWRRLPQPPAATPGDPGWSAMPVDDERAWLQAPGKARRRTALLVGLAVVAVIVGLAVVVVIVLAYRRLQR